YFLFFFQAEDGIRDRNVTGVQTCALPIFHYCMDCCWAILRWPKPKLADTTCRSAFTSGFGLELSHQSWPFLSCMRYVFLLPELSHKHKRSLLLSRTRNPR